MNIRNLGWLIGLGVFASSFLSCTQAKVECTVSQASSGLGFATKYTLKNQPSAECQAYLDAIHDELRSITLPDGVPVYEVPRRSGNVVGFGLYTPPKDDPKSGYVPDRETPGSVAWQTETLGALHDEKGAYDSVDTNEEHKTYALGTFTTLEPDESNYCAVAAPTPAVQEFSAGVSDDPMLSPVYTDQQTHRYEWSNMKLYVTAGAPGTQFSADVKYTLQATNPTTMQNLDCTFEYSAVGLWPAVRCEGEDGGPDDTLCDPKADPEGGRPTGSGINPDIKVKCDPDMLYCTQADGKVQEVTDE